MQTQICARKRYPSKKHQISFGPSQKKHIKKIDFRPPFEYKEILKSY